MSNNKAACLNENAGLWDLDQASIRQLRQAREHCRSCPALEDCSADLAERIAGNDSPRSMIQAARIFDHNGVEISEEDLPRKVRGPRNPVLVPIQSRSANPAEEPGSAELALASR